MTCGMGGETRALWCLPPPELELARACEHEPIMLHDCTHASFMAVLGL